MLPTGTTDELRRLVRSGGIRAAAQRWRDLADAGGPVAIDGLARALLALGNVADARQQVEDGLLQARHEEDENGECRLLGTLSLLYRLQGSASSASDLALRASEAARRTGRVEDLDTAMGDLAAAWSEAGRIGPSLALAEERVMLADGTDAQPEATTELARLLLAAGRHGTAARHATRALAAAKAAGQSGVMAHALSVLARASTERRRYPQAQRLFEAALQAHQRHEDTGGQALSAGGLGLCALGTGRIADGAQWLNQAVALTAAREDLVAELGWRAHLDEALVLLDRPESRLTELTRMIEVVHALGDLQREAALHCERGNALIDAGRPAEALDPYRTALAISEARGDRAAQAVDHANLGRTLAHLGRAEEAEPHLERASRDLPEGSPNWQAVQDLRR